MESHLSEPDALATVRAVLAGERSAVEVARAFLAEIRRADPAIAAYLRVDAEGALACAQTSDRAIARDRERLDRAQLAAKYPLAGVVVGVKDAFVTRGLRTTCGSRVLEHWVPPYDAHVVERVRAAGGTIVGKCNMDEFAMGSSTENSAYGPTRNPWNLDCAPGGSSGGSAAAVSAGLAHVSIGSDTGGSVRQPASFTGIVGFKPTYGRVSRYGLIAFASSLDVVGCLGGNVADTALLFRAIAGPDHRDSTSLDALRSDARSHGIDEDEVGDVGDVDDGALRGLRVGIPREYFVDGIEPGVLSSVRGAIDRIAAASARVDDCSMPHTRFGVAAYYVLAPAEASSNLARYDGVRYGLRRSTPDGSLDGMYGATRDAGFGDEVKRRILLGTFALSEGYYDAFYGKAQRVRTCIRRDFDEAFSNFDVLVMPTSPTVAFALGSRASDPLAMYMSDVCTLPASLAGVPAISIPCGLSNGLPVGLQIVGPSLADTRVLRVARAVEAVVGRLPRPSPRFGRDEAR